ncbi:galactitol-1-phosphate 5-dehydrogenase [Staphylococcus agnetis]|uniref:galactitol-1-phosphate 5-dehydrogenase n=1 Tax=Staphylococcus agnetis TaxID=985762 RepID=UPI000D0432CA|nr:galactitol-1-phosphate 5-dehydrogenase [Staphylococcus agnetis]
MKALNLYDREDLRYEESPKPVITHKDEVIIKVKATGICGSDTSRYKKLGPYESGTTFGHEFSGIVTEVGENVEKFSIGDRVTGCPAIACKKCEYCKKGEYSRCENLFVIGSYRNGSFAEYVKLPEENVLKIPDNIDFNSAAMIEPSAVVAHGFYKTNLKPGMTVAIMGCGSIGLLAIQWAKIFGATRILAIDIDDNKLELAQQFGASDVINSKEVNLEDFIQQFYQNEIDLAVESSGAKVTIGQILTLPKKGGEVLLLGIPYADIEIKRGEFEKILRNELKVIGSWNGLSSNFPGIEWRATIQYMDQGNIVVSPIISHFLPLSEGPNIFKKLIQKKEPINKVIFYNS